MILTNGLSQCVLAVDAVEMLLDQAEGLLNFNQREEFFQPFYENIAQPPKKKKKKKVNIPETRTVM